MRLSHARSPAWTPHPAASNRSQVTLRAPGRAVGPWLAGVPTARSNAVEQYDYTGTVRGRLGYLLDPWMIYATGGFAFAGTRVLNTPPNIDE